MQAMGRGASLDKLGMTGDKLGMIGAGTMLGIYVHLPFCPYICPYCDFAKWPMRKSAAEAYMAALERQIDACEREEAGSIFLGGGTPNTYDAQRIRALIARLQERFPSNGKPQEITIECNPELVGEGDAQQYAAAGINRISIGVQSFDSAEIHTLGRRHTTGDIERAVTRARNSGIRSISLDLIFGVPGQTPRTWRASLETAIGLGVDHISTYGLTIEEGTPFAAWHEREPSAFANEDAEAELYEIAIDTLETAGFEQYEISNFARPGHRSVHNANYWANGEYIGLGVGAASYRNGERSVATRSLERYIQAVQAGFSVPAEAERLEGSKRVGEAIMLALRTAQGVSLAGFKERYGVDVLERYAPVVAAYRDAGMLEIEGPAMRLTRRGRFVANDVCGAFVTFE
jgi:oxygen-independent coproporphyrinogen III oxidase